jgi:hypothetical protein
LRAIPCHHIKTVRDAETLCLFAHVGWQLCWGKVRSVRISRRVVLICCSPRVSPRKHNSATGMSINARSVSIVRS